MYTIAIHGGAGTISKASMTPEKEKAYKRALEESLEAGFEILQRGGTALDAVEVAVVSLEDSPLFNAGKGSVFTAEGRHEMDAAIMAGDTKSAGAVAGVKNIRNPIQLARAVMERSKFVMLAGEGAEEFAREQNIDFEGDEYFFSQERYEQLQEALEGNEMVLDHHESKKFGTVGAVALDQYGNVAAATSTGGLTNKKYGRIGDSPIIGAGTYANNQSCAVSCTGVGEYFIKAVAAFDVAMLMMYKGLELTEACETVVFDKLKKVGGEGGLIAVDTKGNIAMVFNSEGMYRASRKKGEEAVVEIFGS